MVRPRSCGSRECDIARRGRHRELRCENRRRARLRRVVQGAAGDQGEPAGTRVAGRQCPAQLPRHRGRGRSAGRRVVTLQRLQAGRHRALHLRRDVAPGVGRGKQHPQPLQRDGGAPAAACPESIHGGAVPRLRRRSGLPLRVSRAAGPVLLRHQGGAHPVCHDGRPHGMVDSWRLRHARI